MIEKKHIETPLGLRKTFFFDSANLREYRRILGGISWPTGDQPGFACIIGESDHKTVRLKTRNLYVLAEYRQKNIEKLIRATYALQNKYLIDGWHGKEDDVFMMHFIDRFNSKLSKKKKGIYIAEAFLSESVHSLKLYANQILSRTQPAKKSLFFEGKDIIPGELLGLSDEDIKSKKTEDYPAIAALSYVLSALEEPYFDVNKDRELHEIYINRKMVSGL